MRTGQPQPSLNLYLCVIDYSTEWNSITVVILMSGEWEVGQIIQGVQAQTENTLEAL